jgi:3-oxoacyl-[acyl-carrier protein] reductase
MAIELNHAIVPAHDPQASAQFLADAHPLKRLGTPQDVAAVAAFLASGEAAWITGVVVDVAGGAVLV